MKYLVPNTDSSDTSSTYYIDHKRHWWLFSLFVPLVSIMGPALYLIQPSTWVLVVPFILAYVLVPVLDYFIGEDNSNPPESVVSQLEEDPYYRNITLALVPMLWASFLFAAWFVGTQDLTWYQIIITSFSSALICGFGLNLGHELGHKKNKVDRTLAKIVLALGAYGHFFIEHNKGHHRDVATKEDPASSQMGETIYTFVFREIPGAFFRAWELEKTRLEKQNKSAWSLDNEIIQPALITLVLYSTLIFMFGAVMIPFLIIVMAFGAFQLTSANYIEHYGLLREKLDNGRYERCQPKHSWNSNHKVSNWLLFHLQRHSDHHANSARGFQSLRNFEESPQLPNGYFGMFVLAYIPPLFRKVMDPRVVEWAGGDLSKVNIYKPKQEDLLKKYHQSEELILS
jgi:alkane 1-monooxygenase